MTSVVDLLTESKTLALCRVCAAHGFRVSRLEAQGALARLKSLERALEGLLEERGFLERLIAPVWRWHFQHTSGSTRRGGGRSL
jgi:hypothetical protein